LAQEENGTDFSPYGGSVYFYRPATTGKFRVDVGFVNSGDYPSLSLKAHTVEVQFHGFLNGKELQPQELQPPTR
jgi:hypothetical protein